MATVYGSTTNHWRAYMTYTTSESATAVTINVTAAGFQSVNYGFSLSSGVTTTISCTGKTSVSGSGGFSSGTGKTVSKSFKTASFTVSKTTSAQSVKVSAKTVNSSGFCNGTSTASATISVPALAKYTVSYNANGGSGAPSSQTKWYGKALTLSSAKPTRSKYSFLGWATSASASSANASYAPGKSYTGNANLSLYAVWKLNYVAPSVSGLKAYRCNASGEAADEGTYAKVECSWSVSTAVNSANKATGLKVEYKAKSATSWTQAASTNPAAVSGSVSQAIGGGALAIDQAYDVRVTVTDSGGSAAASTSVAKAFFTMDVLAGGRGVAFGAPATEACFEVAMPAKFTGPSISVPDNVAYVKRGNLATENKTLWSSSGSYMSASQTIALSEAVKSQPNGIVLVFSAYTPGDSPSGNVYNWQHFFVPKASIDYNTSSGYTFLLSYNSFAYIGTKYLYISNTAIKGHDNNTATGTKNGVTYANNRFVLSRVLGV